MHRQICVCIYITYIYICRLYMSIYLCICLSVCLPSCLSIHLSICLSIYFCKFLFIYMHIFLSISAYIHTDTYIYIPQQRIRFWGLQSVKQRRGDRGFGSRVSDSVRDVCALDCRYWIWRPQVGGGLEIAAVFSMEHVSLRTERDPSVLAACERSSRFAGTRFLAHGERSKCACGVRKQQSVA